MNKGVPIGKVNVLVKQCISQIHMQYWKKNDSGHNM